MPKEIKIPNLTRIDRRRGIAHDDLSLGRAIFFSYEIEKRYRYTAAIMNLRPIEYLFLSYFSVEDAIYRRDFLSELLEDNTFRKVFDKVYRGVPFKEAHPVYTETRWGERRTHKAIKADIAVIGRYLEIPNALELMVELHGTSEASQELRKFAKAARRYLNDYAKFVEPIRKEFMLKNKRGRMDVECANDCLNKISPFLFRINEVRQIRKSMKYYLTLCLPYEITFNGEMIPHCKPEFLDPEQRQGTIINAYNPSEFKYAHEKKKLIVTELNVPNNIHWGPDARGTFIQGPNSQGKSFYLFTLALNVHLAMAGLLPFADSCVMSPVRQIFPCFDLGDSLEEGHFMTGAYKINNMLNNVGIEDIVLLDEAGGGTEPEAERIISKGLSDALMKYRITFFDVTHDKGAWKEYTGRKGIKMLRVADMDDDKRKYKVWHGIAKGGYAMKLAKRKGIDPKSIKKRLEERLN